MGTILSCVPGAVAYHAGETPMSRCLLLKRAKLRVEADEAWPEWSPRFGDGTNIFAYAYNDPVLLADPVARQKHICG